MKQITSRQAKHRYSILVRQVAVLLFTFLLPISSYSAGTVTNLTWASLDAALSGGGTVTIACDGVIYKSYTNADVILANTVIDATGHNIVLDGGNGSGGQMFVVSNNVSFTLN